MTHYVCTGGCGGVSETPGVCQADGCAKHGKPLIECTCEDGKHSALLAPEQESLEEGSGE